MFKKWKTKYAWGGNCEKKHSKMQLEKCFGWQITTLVSKRTLRQKLYKKLSVSDNWSVSNHEIKNATNVFVFSVEWGKSLWKCCKLNYFLFAHIRKNLDSADFDTKSVVINRYSEEGSIYNWKITSLRSKIVFFGVHSVPRGDGDCDILHRGLLTAVIFRFYLQFQFAPIAIWVCFSINTPGGISGMNWIANLFKMERRKLICIFWLWWLQTARICLFKKNFLNLERFMNTVSIPFRPFTAVAIYMPYIPLFWELDIFTISY